MIIEYLIIVALFFSGCFFILAFDGQTRPLRVLSGAFPLGCCLWSAAVLLSIVLPVPGKDAYGMSIPIAVTVCTILSGSSLYILIVRKHYSVVTVTAVMCGAAGMIMIYQLFLWLNISIITGDSLSQIHPQVGLPAWGNVRGFNQSLAVLAGWTGQDRYFFAYHALFSVSLLVLMGDCIFHEMTKLFLSIIAAYAIALAGPLLMASTFMTAINTFYVNNHMLVGTLIVLAVSLLLERREENGLSSPPALLATIVVSFLCLLRLEGTLTALVLLLLMTGAADVQRHVRVRAFLLFALLNIPFLFFMVFFTSGKVSAVHFIMICSVVAALPVLFALQHPKWLQHVQERTNWGVLLLLVAAIGVFFLLDMHKMNVRVGWFVRNGFDVSYWGFVNHLLVVVMPLLLCLRLVFQAPPLRQTYLRVDLLLLFYIASLLLIVFILNFHPSHAGWTDSQNRMLIHFLPIALIWVSIQTGLGLSARQRRA